MFFESAQVIAQKIRERERFHANQRAEHPCRHGGRTTPYCVPVSSRTTTLFVAVAVASSLVPFTAPAMSQHHVAISLKPLKGGTEVIVTGEEKNCQAALKQLAAKIHAQNIKTDINAVLSPDPTKALATTSGPGSKARKAA